MPLLPPFAAPPPAPHPALCPEAIVETLLPHLRPARVRRVDRVIAQRLASVTVVLERPYDPHNGAAVLRTAEALGLLDVHVIRGDDDFAFSRKVTVNAHKWLNVYIHDDTTSCLQGLRERGYRLWAALPPALGSIPVGPGEALVPRAPTALVFGNEHAGLTQRAIAGCDGRFHLPMYGFTESFNLSVSVALGIAPLVAARRRILGRSRRTPARRTLQ